jgi:hypothetical protein
LGYRFSTVLAGVGLGELSLFVMPEVPLVFVLGLTALIAIGHGAVIGEKGFVAASAVDSMQLRHGSISMLMALSYRADWS